MKGDVVCAEIVSRRRNTRPAEMRSMRPRRPNGPDRRRQGHPMKHCSSTVVAAVHESGFGTKRHSGIRGQTSAFAMTCVNGSFQIPGRADSMNVAFLEWQFARPDQEKGEGHSKIVRRHCIIVL